MTHESHTSERSDAAEERHYALSLLMDAFAEATLDGLPEDSMTQAALFVAFQKLVACYGEEAVAVFRRTFAGTDTPRRILGNQPAVIRACSRRAGRAIKPVGRPAGGFGNSGRPMTF